MKAQRGMTLVELMVTLAIAALLMFAVVPNIASWMRSIEIRNAAESIQAGLQRARNEAVKRNRNVQFSLVSLSNPALMENTCALSSGAGSWVVSLANPAGKCGTDFSDTTDPMIIDRHPVADGGRNVVVSAFQADGAAASAVVFDGFGRLVSATPIARVDIKMAAASEDIRELRVEIAPSGSVRMCDPKVGGTDSRRCLLPSS